MDFSYHYTPEQQDFRAEVARWLDRNAPAEAGAIFDSTGASDFRHLCRQLGAKGWLAPGEPDDLGGAGLSPDLAVIVLEELNRRGLLSLVDGEAQALRSALIAIRDACRAFHSGPRPRPRPAHRLETRRSSSVRIAASTPTPSASPPSPTPTATSSTDEGYFTGIADRPDILWTVALTEPDDAPICLVIDADFGTASPSRRAARSHRRPLVL